MAHGLVMKPARLSLLGRTSSFDPDWVLHNFPSVQAYGRSFMPGPGAIGRVYQDTGLTTPCTAAGQPVAGLYDLSGNGRHLTQATLANRPTLQYATMPDGRLLPALDCGGDDWLANATPGALLRNVGGATLIVVCQTTAPASAIGLLFISQGGSLSIRAILKRRHTIPNSLAIQARRLDGDSVSALEGGAFAPAEFGVQAASINYAAGTAEIFYNGLSVAHDPAFCSAGVTSDTDSLGVSLGGTTAGTLCITGLIFEYCVLGAFISEPLMLRYLREYLQPATGITAIT